jgi:hypothetical protein
MPIIIHPCVAPSICRDDKLRHFPRRITCMHQSTYILWNSTRLQEFTNIVGNIGWAQQVGTTRFGIELVSFNSELLLKCLF